MKTLDLNSDVGEGAGCDARIMQSISSANIACGAHAGDEATMQDTFNLAKSAGVAVGAHPGFPDREHFGRREIKMDPKDLRRSIWRQLETLRAIGPFSYVKPHGALYNIAARDSDMAALVAATIHDFDARLGLLVLAGSKLQAVGERRGLSVRAEAFADRAYTAQGELVPRSEVGAVMADPDIAVRQVLELVERGRVRTITGGWTQLQADSICVHGDNPAAVEFVQRLREKLSESGVPITSPWGSP